MGVLEILKSNYNLFAKTNFEVDFKFREDVYDAFTYFLMNGTYSRGCVENSKKLYDPNRVFVRLNGSNECSLLVLGNDGKTNLVIRENNSDINNYRDASISITENEFIELMDYYQRIKLKRANISSRFIKDEIPPIDICSEMNVEELISHYKNINREDIEIFDEPENEVGYYPKTPGESVERKNLILDYELRRQELLDRNPKKVVKFIGSKTNNELDAYVYERDGYTLAIVEPVSGKGYQYALNLGNVDDDNLIREMIKAALEAKEEIVMLDDAIMRKNHTTIETFRNNLDIFLGNAKSTKKFYYDFEKSKDVYRKL